MKKLILSVFCALCVATSANAYNAPSFDEYTNLNRNNSKQGNPVRELKFVRFADRGPNVASIASRDALVYDTVSDDGITVRLTTTSADGAFAGIAVTTIPTADAASTSASDDAGRRNWGWIVVHGPVVAAVTAGGTNGNAAGDLFITSGDSGTITTMGNSTAGVAQNSEISNVIAASGGFFLDAGDTTSTAVEVFVENE